MALQCCLLGFHILRDAMDKEGRMEKLANSMRREMT